MRWELPPPEGFFRAKVDKASLGENPVRWAQKESRRGRLFQAITPRGHWITFDGDPYPQYDNGRETHREHSAKELEVMEYFTLYELLKK